MARYHICNPNTPQPEDVVNIYSEAEIECVEEDQDTAYVVNIHLNWDGRPLTNDYGFDVANCLRTKKKSLAPIVFYSIDPVQTFEQKSKDKLKYKLLFGRGSAFIKAPFEKLHLEKLISDTPRLTPAALHDVVTMLADVKGMVLDRLNHNLKFGKDPTPYFNEVEPFLSQTQKSLVDFGRYRERLSKANSDGNATEFRELKETFLSICGTSLTEKGKDATSRLEKKHKVLLVEDNKAELKAAADHLKKSFEVLAESDAGKAISKLRADTSNEILAVICDWRLYKDGTEYWQKYQGYEVLEEASKNGFRALFALTSQADFVVHHIRNEMGFRFQLVKKQNVESDQQKALFADMVSTGCSDAISVLSEMPRSANWAKKVKGVSYKDLYFQVKHSLDDGFFDSVLEKADEVWEYVQEQSKTHFHDIKDIRERFGLSISTANKELFPVLCLRLIWLGMWSTLTDTEKSESNVFFKMYKILCTGNNPRTTPEYHRNNATQEMSRLCLTREDVQGSVLLPHERAWMLKHGLL